MSELFRLDFTKSSCRSTRRGVSAARKVSMGRSSSAQDIGDLVVPAADRERECRRLGELAFDAALE